MSLQTSQQWESVSFYLMNIFFILSVAKVNAVSVYFPVFIRQWDNIDKHSIRIILTGEIVQALHRILFGCVIFFFCYYLEVGSMH